MTTWGKRILKLNFKWNPSLKRWANQKFVRNHYIQFSSRRGTGNDSPELRQFVRGTTLEQRSSRPVRATQRRKNTKRWKETQVLLLRRQSCTLPSTPCSTAGFTRWKRKWKWRQNLSRNQMNQIISSKTGSLVILEQDLLPTDWEDQSEGAQSSWGNWADKIKLAKKNDEKNQSRQQLFSDLLRTTCPLCSPRRWSSLWSDILLRGLCRRSGISWYNCLAEICKRLKQNIMTY